MHITIIRQHICLRSEKPQRTHQLKTTSGQLNPINHYVKDSYSRHKETYNLMYTPKLCKTVDQPEYLQYFLTHSINKLLTITQICSSKMKQEHH